MKTFEVSVRDVASLLAMSGMTNDNNIVDHLKNPLKRKKKIKAEQHGPLK